MSKPMSNKSFESVKPLIEQVELAEARLRDLHRQLRQGEYRESSEQYAWPVFEKVPDLQLKEWEVADAKTVFLKCLRMGVFLGKASLIPTRADLGTIGLLTMYREALAICLNKARKEKTPCTVFLHHRLQAYEGARITVGFKGARPLTGVVGRNSHLLCEHLIGGVKVSMGKEVLSVTTLEGLDKGMVKEWKEVA